MTKKPCVAIVYPGDGRPTTSLAGSRHAETANALAAVGLDVVGTPYADSIADEVRAHLLGVDGVLVWYNPIEGGRDRSMLNAVLRDVASKGVFVSAHPDVIDRIGTKEVLYHTRGMGWGCDTHLYATPDAMGDGLPASLASGEQRVLKQIRGQSGDGVWQVAKADADAGGPLVSTRLSNPILRIRHAKRGSPEELMPKSAFVARCEPYFATGGMIDQAYQARLPEGMIRCYIVGDRVAGFGEQLINMLYPAAPGAPAIEAPLPGPRLYYPPTRPDFQRLKMNLEREWIDDLCRTVGLDKSLLPALWDADFLYGPKNADGADTYVLCEINVSSVHPFPLDALKPLAEHTRSRVTAAR